MTEKPIIFSGPMVRAILDGRKTMTRRILRKQPEGAWAAPGKTACPYGIPGDRLWVTMGSKATRTTGFENRFWERVIKFGDCWEWFGRTNKKKYGVIRKGVKTYSAHRVSWEIHNGPIPNGMHVLHTCDMPWCVNPSHLWLGTNTDNIADKMEKGRHRSPAGENQKDSFLSREQVEEIRSLYWEQYLYQKDIASKFGVHQSQISKIVNNKQWNDADPLPEVIGHRVIEIVSVRVERVKEISGPDCIAEGVKKLTRADDGPPLEGNPWREQKAAFRALWESIHGPGSWERNDWCWVIEFRRLP